MSNRGDINRCTERWYRLKDHPVQHALVYDKVRFKVCAAGRRSGKTEKAKRNIVKVSMSRPGNYFVGAPTHQQVKRIYWNDLKLLSFAPALPEPPLDGELIIRYPNGSRLFCIGLDKPQRFEGIPWSGGVIDEIADVKENAFKENIRPALDTWHPGIEELPWCWFIGVHDRDWETG